MQHRHLPLGVSLLALSFVCTVSLPPSTSAHERRMPGQARTARVHDLIATGGQHTLLVDRGLLFAWGDNGAGQLGTGSPGPFVDAPTPVTQSTGLAGVVAVAAGAVHSVALDSTGHVWTWGDNSSGQLGDSLTLSRAAPFKLAGIPGLSGRVTAIAAGDQHTLALTAAGEVFAWGENGSGQLGDGSTADSSVPLFVPGVADTKQISGGGAHSLALDVRGRIWAWGGNARGQIGDGTTMQRAIPVELFPGDPAKRFIELSGGFEHSLGIDDRGVVWSWGADNEGQLGNGVPSADQLSPFPVNTTNGFVRAVCVAAGGQHSLALTARGRVYAWGSNGEGQVGDGSIPPGPQRDDPVLVNQIGGLPGATAVAAGHLHSAALQSEGKALAWGSNISGQVGDGSAAPVASPVEVPGMVLSGVMATAGAWRQSYVMQADGSVWAWGGNGEGQLGDGTDTTRLSPQPVAGVSNVIAISANTSNVLVLRSDGTVWGWGKNQHGQMNLPTGSSGVNCPVTISTNVCTPIQMGAGLLTDVKAIAAGTYFHLVLNADGTVWSWGDNGHGQLGRGVGPDDNNPLPVPGLAGSIAIAGGGDHGLALLSDGTVRAWGRNIDCELGTTSCCDNGQAAPPDRCDRMTLIPPPTVPLDEPLPAPVRGQGGAGLLSRITAINAGLYHHSLAIDVNGRVWAWGNNVDGQLGDGNFMPSWVGSYPGTVVHPPSPSGILEDTTAVAGGAAHSVALKADGTLYGWGGDSSGQLGDGSPTSVEPVPVTVGCTYGVIGLQSGGGLEHTTLRRDDWTRCATGGNGSGELGDGTTTGTSAYACQTSPAGASLRHGPAKARLAWKPVAAATSYRVYRGDRPGGASFSFNHTCLTPGGVSGCPATVVPCPPEHLDPVQPASPGDLQYYLVTTRSAGCVEDHLGRESSYELRPNSTPCP